MTSVLETLLPILLLFVLGVSLRYGGFCTEGSARQLNRLTFWVLLPCQLFLEISGSENAFSSETIRMALFILASCLLVLLLGAVVRKLLASSADAGVFLQGVMRGNLVYVGFPVLLFFLPGEENDAVRQPVMLATALIIPVYNILSVALLGISAANKNHSTRARLLQACRGILTNPLIIACLLGSFFSVLQIPLPLFLTRTLKGLGNASFAIALIALGASFTISRLRPGLLRAALLSAGLRVFATPCIGLLLALCLPAFFGLPADMLTAGLLFLATPTAVASFVMADQMGCDGELAAAIVILSTLLSFLAMAGILLLRAASIM